MTCRERAGQVRDRYQEILATGSDVTAIGTGGRNFARAFVEDEQVPFEVLLDEDGTAAEIVGTGQLSAKSLLAPGQVKSGARAFLAGHRQTKRPGARPMQLGATLVIGPRDTLLYSDFEKHAGDHADLDAVLNALTRWSSHAAGS
ncbi:MAG: AhpC/TSA family protein [Acidimicrobiia bacterium]